MFGRSLSGARDGPCGNGNHEGDDGRAASRDGTGERRVLTEMYTEFFELLRPPFLAEPDADFFYASRTHARAMAHLHYAARQSGGLVVITGPAGAGKTMALARFFQQIDGAAIVAARLDAHEGLERQGLLCAALEAFNETPVPDASDTKIAAFEGMLIENRRAGCRTFLAIDAAHRLGPRALSDLQALIGLRHGEDGLLQVALAGRAALATMLADEGLAALSAQTIVSCTLEALQPREIKPYVEARLAAAGWRGGSLFLEPAIERLFDLSGGNPRALNQLCDQAMTRAAASGVREIDAATINAAVRAPAQLFPAPTPIDAAGRSATTAQRAPVEPAPLASPTAPSYVAAAGETCFDRLQNLRSRRGGPSPATLDDLADAIASVGGDYGSDPLDELDDEGPFDIALADDAIALHDANGGAPALGEETRAEIAAALDVARRELARTGEKLAEARALLGAAAARNEARRARLLDQISAAEALVRRLAAADDDAAPLGG